MLPSKIQGTQALIHYIEGFIAQLVKHKALNLVDVGSSPMVELHHMMLFSMKHDHIYKVPAHYLHNDPALGDYTGYSFYEHRAITSPRLLQA